MMKFSKKLFKKLLCTSLSAVMLIGTMSFGTVFASTGKLADRQMSDIVEYQTVNNTNLFATIPPGSVAQDGDSIKITNYVNANTGAISEFTQPVTRAFSVNKTDEIMGSFIFKLKADAANNSKHSLLFSILDPDVEGSKEITALIMDQAGKLGSQNPPSWTYTLDGPSRDYVKGTYYTVGFVLKNNYTYNIFINGEDIGTFKITNDDFRAMLDKMSKLKFKLTVHNGDNGAGNSAVFYMKDAVWQIGGGELVAELEKTSYSAGDTATVKFSAPLAGTIDTEAVKLYESATGVPVDGTSVTYENGEFKVTIPASIKSGAEYRIELPTVTDCIGNTLKNDNVYFNAAQGGNAYEVIDTYETFDSLGTGNYVAPTGWVMHSRGAANRGFSEKYVDSGNNTLKIGEDDTTANAWKQVGMYHNLNKKYTDGTVSISYDIKPLTASVVPRYDGYIPINIGLIGFSDAISGSVEIQNATLGGKVLAGTAGNRIGAPKGASDASNHFSSGELDSKWYTAHTITEADFNKWFNVKVDLDLDAGNYTYYLDGQKQYDSPLSTIGLSGGISSIAFHISDLTKKSDQLIDNIKVSHITSKTLDTATTAFSDDFSGYYKRQWTPEEASNNYTINFGNAWVPQGWGHMNLNWNQAAPVLLPTTVDAEHGNSLEMGIQLDTSNSNAQWNNPELYHRLGQKYTNGVLTVAYEVNPKTLIDIDDSRLEAAKTAGWYTSGTASNSFGFTLYADNYSESEGTSASGSNKINSKYGMRIFGVQDKNFSVYTNNQLKNGLYGYSAKSSAEEGQWYKVRHIIDIENDSIETYIGTSDANMNLFGVNHLSYFSNKDGVSLADGIGGIGFCVNQSSYLSYTYLDNVSVSYAPFKSQKGVSAVRYSDYKDNIYGSSDSTTTLIDTVALAFTDAPDVIDGKVTITDSKGNSIGYSGTLDSETNTYVMNLSEFLTAAEIYTLTVDGVTFGGEAMDTYTHTIYAEANGEFIIEPMTISVNNVVKSTGTNIGKQQLASGDTVKATVRVINTTGQKKDFAFSAGIYKDKLLDKFDYRTVSLDGTSTNGKYAEESCTFTMGADASEVTKVRTFLWNGMKDMLPLMESCDLDCSAE